MFSQIIDLLTSVVGLFGVLLNIVLILLLIQKERNKSE